MKRPGCATVHVGFVAFILLGRFCSMPLNTGRQGALALEFYNSIASVSGVAPVLLTGHSLGGGLAGYVGALTATQARIFDYMPFETAANNNFLSYKRAA